MPEPSTEEGSNNRDTLRYELKAWFLQHIGTFRGPTAGKFFVRAFGDMYFSAVRVLFDSTRWLPNAEDMRRDPPLWWAERSRT